MKLAHPVRILTHLLRADLIPEAWAPLREVRELRDLMRLRWRSISQRTTAKNRITNLLARGNLHYAGTDLFGTKGRKWLEELDLPGPVRHHYLALVRRRGKKVALVAAARVLLELSWALLHKKEVFLAA